MDVASLDGARLLTLPSTVDVMLSDRHRGHGNREDRPFDKVLDGSSWGLGLGVRRAGAPIPMLACPGTFGWVGHAGSLFCADRERDLLGIALFQQPEFLLDNARTLKTPIMQSALD